MSKLILTIDTVSPTSSLGLVRGEETIDQIFFESKRENKEELSYHLNQLINKNLKAPIEIDTVALINGPGSFSSLRAGLALAKGLTFAINKPLVGLSTFYAMVHAYKYDIGRTFEKLVPLVDARKGKFFKAAYNKHYELIEKEELIFFDYFHSIDNKENSIVLLLNGINVDDFDSTPLHYKTINLLPIQQIAYMEPKYLVNNYKK